MYYGSDGRRYFEVEDDLLITELWLEAVEEDAPDPENFSGKIAGRHWEYIAKRLTAKVGRLVKPSHVETRWNRIEDNTRPRTFDPTKYGRREPFSYMDFLFDTTYERNQLKINASLWLKQEFLTPVYKMVELLEKEIPEAWVNFCGKHAGVWTIFVNHGFESVACYWDPEHNLFGILNYTESKLATKLRPRVQVVLDKQDYFSGSI